MQPFDAIQSPINGTCLIEAGAGTGKTHTITTLVLRLILEEALLPEQILVVTFTTAATAELRDRVRRRLQDARHILQGRSSGDAVLGALLDQGGPREIALARIEDALANFDRMPVFTIHGFCHRVLNEMAFETGNGFDAELVTDARLIIQGLADDFWRRTWHEASPELIDTVFKTIKKPDDLAQLYSSYAIPDLKILPDPPPLTSVSNTVFRECCAKTRRQWRQCRDTVLPMLATPNLKANIYGGSDRPASRDDFRSKRDEKIDIWRHQMDRWSLSSTSGLPLPDALTYLSQTKLDASIKKGTQAPQHPFFVSCDRLREETQRLETAIQQWVIAWQVRFFNVIDEELARYKQDNQVLFFDDLLVLVRNALREDHNGELSGMLRSRYRAVLIDEFQDTDPVQYAIFKTLFTTGEHRMFLIGDPKQSIYSFRGADIVTYLEAAQSTGTRYTLTQNWRSTPDMVHAVNVLFGQCNYPFVWPDIAFRPATAALAGSSVPSIPDGLSSLTIWFLDNPAAKKGRGKVTKKTASKHIGVAVAHEVARLVGMSTPAKGGVAFRDVAILVRTNRQAQEIKRCFAAASIPAVVYNAGSVFHRPEALDLRRVLDAVADPAAETAVRTALTTPFFGQKGDALDFNTQTPRWWENLLDRFFHYRALWIENGFIRMFRHLMVNEQIVVRLLKRPDGERYVTNVLHLAELMHQVSVDRGLGMGELIQWLNMQRLEPYDTADAHQTRLESDDDAVTILTIHKSKGLEFPIVFCPFVWEGLSSFRPPALFHDADQDGRRMLDLGSTEIERHMARMAEEQMAEALRLLYVAVTRAKIRCYLTWGKLPSAEKSAMAYLMHAGHDSHTNEALWPQLQAMASAFLKQDSASHRQDILDLAHRSDGTITVVDLPQTADQPSGKKKPSTFVENPRIFRRPAKPPWKIASFSSLVHHRHDDTEIPEERLDREETGHDRFHVTETGDPSQSIGDIGRFEASARAGLFFHELLEKIDFTTATTDEQWLHLVDERMRHYGFDRHWREPIMTMLQRVIHTPLDRHDGASYTLHQVAPKHRLTELAFHLPLGAVDAASLGQAFSACRLPVFQDRLPVLMNQLDFTLSGGYLKGYIDLVLRHDHRYFIVDWKSNLLGGIFEDYRLSRLAEVMQTDFYFLQYHLYTLALDQYLRSSCSDYSYQRDFGGIYYLFIRGMQSFAGSTTGVFFDRPAPELIRDLRRALGIPSTTINDPDHVC